MIDIDPNLPEPHALSTKPLNLSDFAQRNQMTEDRVWELIEEGELAARFVNDEILILREVDGEQDRPEPLVDPVATPLVEIPLPERNTSEALAAPEVDTNQKVPTFNDANESDSDMQLPTDDARDLLMFAQDAMTRTMELSGQLLATKDELIRLKDEKILQQQTELQRLEAEIRRLKRKVEDLETLCRMSVGT